MRLVIGSDHAGFEAKNKLVVALKKEFKDIEINDIGTNSTESVNYNFFAKKLVSEVVSVDTSPIWEPRVFGILICGTGIGMSIQANRDRSIRASVCRSVLEAEATRKHNNANVLCLGARVNSDDEIFNIAKTFLSTKFEGGRHEKRVLDL